jgi:hypothetical protein
MRAKLTTRNRLTLPKAAVSAVGATEYFDIELRGKQIVLTPLERGDAVRAKLAEIRLDEADVARATQWARSVRKEQG